MKRYYDSRINKIVGESELNEYVHEITDDDIIEVFDEDGECLYNGIWYGPGVYVVYNGRLCPVD